MNIGIWLGAVCPICVLFVSLTVLRMKTEQAALLGTVCAGVCAILAGKANLTIVGIDLCKGAFSAFNILLVIWPAVFLYELLQYGKIFDSVKEMLQRRTEDQLMLILLFCWLFSSFLQGITGFGVPVAICGPLLCTIGVKPLWAVMITLLGHAWANTYGTFALAWNELIAQSETTEVFKTKLLAGLFLWGVNLVGALLICWLYGRRKGVRHMLPFVLAMSTIHGAGQLLVSFLNATIAAFIPTTLALAVSYCFLRAGLYTRPWSMDSPMMEQEGREEIKGERGTGGKSFYAVFPFLLLTALSVLILLVQPIYRMLYQPVIQLSFPGTETGRGFAVKATDSYGAIHILTHAGFLLLITAVCTYLLYRRRGLLPANQLPSVWRATLKKALPTSLGILFLVSMAQVLKGSGLMEIIAKGVTQVTGHYYGAAASLVGLLGAFVTSSNTSSNILLGSFQKTAAELIGFSEGIMLAAQTAGGAVGTVVGPSTIFLGTTTVGCRGQEGKVLRFMLPIAVAQALLIGILVLCL